MDDSMLELIAVVLLVSLVAWVVRSTPHCPQIQCDYQSTPQLARPSIHHVPFRYPRDTGNSDQMNYIARS
jgi:hypothetical protein